MRNISPDQLREKATKQAVYRKNPYPDIENLSIEEAKSIISELQIHKVELEMQNEELRKTHEELRISKLRHREMFSLAPIAYFAINSASTIKDANIQAGQLLKKDRSRIIHRQLLEFIHPKDILAFKHFIKQLVKKKEPQQTELRFINGDNEEFFGLINGIYLKDLSNKVQIWIVLDNITNQKMLEQDLLVAQSKAEKANKTKSKLISSLSHDIRSALNGVLGITQLIQGRKIPAAKTETYFKVIFEGANSIKDIVENILMQSKLEGGEMTLNIEPFHLPNMIGEVLSTFTFVAQQKGFKIIPKIYKDTPDQYLGDVHFLKRVLSNLVANALKYAGNGIIEIEASYRDSHLYITVNDEGPGISQENVDSIFKEFMQIDDNHTTGTGLGLYICKHLVDLMRGDIWYKPNEPKGASFKLAIPLIPHNQLKEKSPLTLISNELPAMNLLIIDDEPMTSQLFREFLESYQVKIFYFKSGKDAVHYLDDHHKTINLAVIDLQMPEWDGFKTIEEIRKREKKEGRHRLPIIVHSSADQPQIQRAIKMGGNYALSKPLNYSNFKNFFLKIAKSALSRNFLDWDNAYNIGYGQIDQQHQEMFKQINQLYKNFNTSTVTDDFKKLFDFQTTYVQDHFSLEEALFMKSEYPNKKAHVKTHREFAATIEQFKKELASGNSEIQSKILYWMKDWAFNHVLKSDQELKNYLP